MSASEPAGIVALARVLGRLAGGASPTVAALAAELDLPRSSAFALVRALEDADLVEREPAGAIVPGPAAAALGLARAGLAGLNEAADALLGWLRDQTEGTAALYAADTPDGLPLIERRANWDGGAAAPLRVAVVRLEAPLVDSAGRGRGLVRLDVKACAGPAHRAKAEAALAGVAGELARYLTSETIE